MITDQHIQFIRRDLEKKGLSMPGLDADILDHLLCGTEEQMHKGHSFEQAYRMACHSLHGQQPLITLQQQTIGALNEGKRTARNMIAYGLTLAALITSFKLIATQVSPALILVCISLAIFFVFHAFFQARKHRSVKDNLRLFATMTSTGVAAVVIFLCLEFKGAGLIRMGAWSLLIMGVAIPFYLKAIRKVLSMDRTLSTLIGHSLELVAQMSLLWIPLALAVKLYRSEVAVFFFLDDLLLMSLSAFFLSISLRKLPLLKTFLKKTL